MTRLSLATLGAGLALVGCGDDGGGGGMPDGGSLVDSGPADGGPPPQANIRVVHAAVGAGPVDIYLAGATDSPLQSGVGFRQVLGPIPAPTNLAVDLYAAGTDPAANDPVYTFNAAGNRIFAGGQTYTIVVRTTDAGGIVAPYFPDAQIPDAATGEVGARFINATTPVEPFSVDTNGNGTSDTQEAQAGGSVDALFSSTQRTLTVYDGSRPVRRLANFVLEDGLLPGAGAVYFVGTGNPLALPEDPEGFSFVFIDTGSGDFEVLQPDVPQARIRVLHASAGAPPVDIYPAGATGGSPIVDGLPYGSVTGYVAVSTDVAVDIYPTGANPATDDPILTVNEDGDAILTRNEDYTLIAVGDASAEADPSVAFRVLPVEDTFSPPGTGNFQARIVHASPTTPTVGIDVSGDAEPDTDPIGLFQTLDAALPVANTLRATVFDVTGDPRRLTSFTVPGGTFTAGSLVYVVAAGGSGSHPGDADALVLLAAPYVRSASATTEAALVRQDPMLWAFHGVPDVGTPVDLAVIDEADMDAATASGIVFGNLTGRIQLAPGTYGFEVRVDGTPASSDDTTVVAMAGSRYLVAAVGLAAPDGSDPDNAIEFLVLEDLFDRTDAANARVRGVHAAPDGSGVTVGTVTADLDGYDVFTQIAAFGRLTYRTSATDAGVSLPPGTVDLGVDDGVTTPTAVFEDVELVAGGRTFLVAAGEFVPDGLGQSPVTLFAIETGSGPWSASSYPVRLPNLPPPPTF